MLLQFNTCRKQKCRCFWRKTAQWKVSSVCRIVLDTNLSPVCHCFALEIMLPFLNIHSWSWALMKGYTWDCLIPHPDPLSVLLTKSNRSTNTLSSRLLCPQFWLYPGLAYIIRIAGPLAFQRYLTYLGTYKGGLRKTPDLSWSMQSPASGT